MLKNYLTAIPYTKFVLIQDSVHDRGKPIFDFLLKTHLEKPESKIHYLVFQERYGKSKSILNYRNLVLYDFVSNVLGWNEEPKVISLEDVIKNVGVRDIIFIDSLAHTIYEYGLAETYRVLNTLKNQTGIQQIVALLHRDLLEDTIKVQQLLQHLSTFSISLLPENEKDNRRIQYTYKKLGGKVVKEVEEYLLEGDSFLTQKIEKLTPEQILKNSIPAEINPDTLSTFKIGLSDLDKKARDELVLPYLPKEETRKNQESGKIFYQFDEVDDWDEEDPDDDLDI